MCVFLCVYMFLMLFLFSFSFFGLVIFFFLLHGSFPNLFWFPSLCFVCMHEYMFVFVCVCLYMYVYVFFMQFLFFFLLILSYSWWFCIWLFVLHARRHGVGMVMRRGGSGRKWRKRNCDQNITYENNISKFNDWILLRLFRKE